jgi:hypothetical protein
MSRPLFEWRTALRESELRPALKHLGLAMSLYVDQNAPNCYASAATLARDTSMNVGAVHRLRGELTELGWLECLRKGGSKRGEKRETSSFKLTTPRVQDDQSSTSTGDPESSDPASSIVGPRAEDAAISNGSLNGSLKSPTTRGGSPVEGTQARADRILARIRSSALPWERAQAKSIDMAKLCRIIDLHAPDAPDESIAGAILGQPNSLHLYRRQQAVAV